MTFPDMTTHVDLHEVVAEPEEALECDSSSNSGHCGFAGLGSPVQQPAGHRRTPLISSWLNLACSLAALQRLLQVLPHHQQLAPCASFSMAVLVMFGP